ncbi:MAG: hypothetical protein EBZ49_02005 [Proteobacteria bacterium]|nr:hypothetical protein [Pseudomonadota bacterium]
MGFLDHSTNNIIVDAVLTDKGREALANGSFSVESFSLSDDEVDYSIIKKFGRTVGKEKIIKNTPIFEAQTIGTLAMKHRLFTTSDPTIINLPTVSVSPSVFPVRLVSNSSVTSSSRARLVLTQTITSGDPTSLPRDTQYTIEVPSRFIVCETGTSSTVESSTQTEIYIAVSDSGIPASVLSQITVNLAAKSLTATDFNAFGTTSDKNTIDCVVSVIGNSTGLRTIIPVQVTRPTL